MKRLIDRRMLILAAGVAAIATAAQTLAAQPADINGTITYAGKKAIPKGQIEVYLEDPAVQSKSQDFAGMTRLKSNGGAQSLAFSMPLPASAAPSPTLQVVARLEREDGWLLARGSAKVRAGMPIEIKLNTVMY